MFTVFQMMQMCECRAYSAHYRNCGSKYSHVSSATYAHWIWNVFNAIFVLQSGGHNKTRYCRSVGKTGPISALLVYRTQFAYINNIFN